ncbi:MAG: Fic family protein [Ruminococcaceae bacterium]|nr:Fic family protein [Oscillospiraceae bacterium]
MPEYIPPYEITDKILSLVASISEKIGRITERSSLSSKPHLRKNNKIKSIYSSLAIEANSLSFGEVKDVISGKTVIGKEKEIQEVKNAYAAYEEVSKLDVYSLKELKRLHGIMTKYTVNISGEFRRGEEGVFNGDKCIFMAPPARFVPSQMEDLFNWMTEKKDTVHPLILSAVFHYEFVFIHPFTDGNGRMARLWHTALLAKWQPIFEYIPIESQIEKFQNGYYDAIAKCHKESSSTFFIEFMLEQIYTILNEVSATVTSPFDNLSEYVTRLLSVMKYDKAYSANEILALLGLKSKETLRKNYLTPAIKDGLISMSEPDKPRSKNQRYIKTHSAD